MARTAHNHVDFERVTIGGLGPGQLLVGAIGSCRPHLPRRGRDNVPPKGAVTASFFGDPPAGRPRPGESPQAWNDTVRAQIAA